MSKKVFRLTQKERDSLAEKMRELRGLMTQPVLADRMGIPNKRKWIGEFEHGRKEPTQALLLSFASAVNRQIFDVISQESFSKLLPDAVSLQVPAFDLDKAKEEAPIESDGFDIMINDKLLDMVSKKNPYDIPMSIIIAAGLNHYLNMSTHDALVYLLKNVKDKTFEKVLIDKIRDKEEYTDGIEVMRTLSIRK